MAQPADRLTPVALSSVFGFLSQQECATLLPYCSLHKVSKDNNLFSVGDTADALYVVLTGILAVKKNTELGRSNQVIALLHPGAPVGEAALVCRAERSTTLYCVEDAELVRLARQDFVNLKSRSPELALVLLDYLLSRVCLRLDKCSARLAHIL